MAKGRIKFLKDNYGFIQQSVAGDDVYFHGDKLEDIAFRQLNSGMEVEFEAERGAKGLRAKFVRVPSAQPQSGEQQISTAPVLSQARQSRSGHRFLNPYNFVRFLGEGSASNANKDTALLGRSAPPPQDRYVGLTGRITCSLETATPLFISDSEGIQGKGHKTYRFFQVMDKYTIPGTSLRGMARTMFETATNSCLMVFEGRRLSKHFDPKLAPTLVPARVEGDGDEKRLRLLTGMAHLGKDYAPERGQALPAAWIHQYWPIDPSKTLLNDDPQGNPQTVQRILDFQARADGPPIDLQGLAHGQECFALLQRTRHPHPRIIFWDVLRISNDLHLLEEQRTGQQKVFRGWLCITKQNIEPKHSERFFFVDTTQRQLPETIKLPKATCAAYEDLIKDYQERHTKERKEARTKNKAPMEMNAEAELELSRFILDDEEREVRHGALVYARLNGDLANPTAEFIAPVSVPRISYRRSIADLQPKHLRACDKPGELCPACRTFGWVHQKPQKSLKQAAYAGRVRFSHAKLKGEPRLLGESIPLAILSSPKPTTAKFYLLDDQWPSSEEKLDYDWPNARLRGRKFYRHHGNANLQEYRCATDDAHSGEGNQNRTVKGVLDKGNEFTFTVDFENLAPMELGALLWTLELEDGWVHRLGFAKPLGFGSVKIKINKVESLDPRKRYLSFGYDMFLDVTQSKEKCINRFKAAMRERHGKDFENLDNIQDLSILLQKPPLPVHYPRPPFEKEPNGYIDKPDPEGKQYEWFVGSKGKYPLPLPTREKDSGGFPLIDRKGNVFDSGDSS